MNALEHEFENGVVGILIDGRFLFGVVVGTSTPIDRGSKKLLEHMYTATENEVVKRERIHGMLEGSTWET